MIFKRYFYESLKQRPARKPKLEGYTTPPAFGAKFKEGDIVLVNVPMYGTSTSSEQEVVNYFRSYHPALAVPYIAKAGVVKLYKRGSVGFGAKYGVLFEDGNIIPIHSMFLIGPFASLESAKKYKGIHSHRVNIEAVDLAGFEPDSEVEVDEKVENAFKSHFVGGEVDFEWLETPIVIKYRTFDCYVLAYKRNKYPKEQMETNRLEFLSNNIAMDRLDNPIYPQYDNCFVFCKVINKQTKKLQKTQVLSSVSYCGPGFYFIQTPELSRRVYSDAFEGHLVKNHLKLYNINTIPFRASTKQCEEIKTNFKLFEDEASIKTGYEHFKTLYKIKEGQTIVSNGNNEVLIQEERFGPDFKEISKYSINGDCTIYLEQSTQNVSHVPLKANELTITGRKLNSLEGIEKCDIQKELQISCSLKNLKGFPENINQKGKTFEVNELDSLEEIPDLVLCDIDIRELKSFVGARNSVCKGRVQVRKFTGKELTGFFEEAEDFSSWTISDKDIAEHKKFRDLKKKLPEVEGLFD